MYSVMDANMVIFTIGGCCCEVGCIVDRRIDDGSINVSIVMATSHILNHNYHEPHSSLFEVECGIVNLGTVMGFLPPRLN